MEEVVRLRHPSSFSSTKNKGTKMKCKKFIYAHKFEDLPKDSDFQLVEEELPALKDGGMYIGLA